MTKNPHFEALENMYLAAPINEFFDPKIEISDAFSVIEIKIREKYFHAAGAVHGSVYFKMLDDAAYFAASSLETELFLVTTSFTTYLTRPVSEGVIRSEGRVVNKNKSQIIAEAVAFNSENKEIGRGSGIFVRGSIKFGNAPGYNF